jgi:hypothetical protein
MTTLPQSIVFVLAHLLLITVLALLWLLAFDAALDVMSLMP